MASSSSSHDLTEGGSLPGGKYTAAELNSMSMDDVTKTAELAVQEKQYERGIQLWMEAERRQPHATDIKISVRATVFDRLSSRCFGSRLLIYIN
jgi:hypothetical protein